jgi:hypothetical protein
MEGLLFALWIFGPAAGVGVVAFFLLARPEWTFRIAGLAAVALAVAYLAAFQAWDNNGCWDAGDPASCGSVLSVLRVTWLASWGVILLGIAAAVWRRVRRRSPHRFSKR